MSQTHSDMTCRTDEQILHQLWTYRKQMQALILLSRNIAEKMDDSDAFGEINKSLNNINHVLMDHGEKIAVEVGHICIDRERAES